MPDNPAGHNGLYINQRRHNSILRWHMLSPQEAALRGRIGAYALHAKYDARVTTQKARETFLSRFLDEVDPDRTLPEEERLRRAAYAKKVYFARLALASARKRSKNAKHTPRRVVWRDFIPEPTSARPVT